MKKCASCSKDLPEAALHCVFCGAKQAPAPAVQPGLAKTAFGYSANEVMQQLGNQPPPAAPPQRAQPPSQPPPYYPVGSQPVSSGPVGGLGIHSPAQLTPQPLPTAPPPYLASTTAARAGKPIEPWQQSLKLMMFIWGALALVAFAAPLHADPTHFRWEGLGDAPMKMKLAVLMLPAVGLLSIVLAAIPLAAVMRGLMAAVLGLAGVLVPLLVIGEMPSWTALVGIVGLLAFIPGLLVRNEYVDSLLSRMLVTIGVVCILLPLLVPHGDSGVPLVRIFKALIDAPGKHKIEPLLQLGIVVIAVMSLLAWIPGPATGGGKVFAWLAILWVTLGTQLGHLVMAGDIGDAISKTPGPALLEWVELAVYLVLTGYGLATVIGKQLE